MLSLEQVVQENNSREPLLQQRVFFPATAVVNFPDNSNSHLGRKKSAVKHQLAGKPAHVTFLDFSKALDTVSHRTLLDKASSTQRENCVT